MDAAAVTETRPYGSCSKLNANKKIFLLSLLRCLILIFIVQYSSKYPFGFFFFCCCMWTGKRSRQRKLVEQKLRQDLWFFKDLSVKKADWFEKEKKIHVNLKSVQA